MDHLRHVTLILGLKEKGRMGEMGGRELVPRRDALARESDLKFRAEFVSNRLATLIDYMYQQ